MLMALALLFPAEADSVRVAGSDEVAFSRKLPALLVTTRDAASASTTSTVARAGRQAAVTNVGIGVGGCYEDCWITQGIGLTRSVAGFPCT